MCRSMSAATSSTRMRQPSCSPKNVTLLPTTGPRSTISGLSRAWRPRQELLQRLGGMGEVGRGGRARIDTGIALGHAARAEKRKQVGERARFGHASPVRVSGPALGADLLTLRLCARLHGGGRGGGLAAGFAEPRCMSTLPRKCAPSAIATRGEAMSPSTEPLSRMSTFSDAVTLPVTSPSTTTDFAKTSALILPLGPMVSTLSLSSILPSTWPSIVRSSLPLSSPLMMTDLPMYSRCPSQSGDPRLAGSRSPLAVGAERRRRSGRRWRGRLDRLITLPHR